jgi:hypothetical protein
MEYVYNGEVVGGAVRQERRSQRIIASVPLEIQPVVPGYNAETAVINLHGALIVTPIHWPVGTVLKIRNGLTDHEILGHVTWIGAQDSDGRFKVGIEFEAAVNDFWGGSYNPAPQEAEKW